MKTRTDFVSNSSSCSFMIEEPKKFIELVNKELGSSCFCRDFNCLVLRVFADVADKAVFESIYDMAYAYEFDGKAYATLPLENLISINDDVLSKLKAIELECNDSETCSVVKLSLLKRALANTGVKVDSSMSEHSLMFEGNDELPAMAKLYAMAFTKDV